MLEDLSYIDCEDLLKSTGINNVSQSSGEISFSCPSVEHFHGDNSPSARMNSRTSAFVCHSCGVRGNGITFLAWHKSIPETVARRLLEERYGGGGISAGVGTLEEEVKRIMTPVVVKEEKRTPPAESWLEKFYIDWTVASGNPTDYVKYMLDRGFNYQILEDWEIGYDEYSRRITIPIRDHEGKLVGFKGRSYNDDHLPKYMIMGDNYNNKKYYNFQPYKKSQYVFGLDVIQKIIDSHYRIYSDSCKYFCICEGELNTIAMNQHGFYATVGIAGSEFSETQCELIKKYAESVVLFLDNDKAGEKGAKKVVEMLSPYMPIKIVQNAPGDAAELDTQTVQELISSAQLSLVLQTAGKL